MQMSIICLSYFIFITNVKPLFKVFTSCDHIKYVDKRSNKKGKTRS